jgi:hypothetical protein
MSHYQLVGPPGWVVGSELLTPHPDYFTTLLWRQLVGDRVLATNFSSPRQPALQDGVELSVWCAAPLTSPFGAGTVVLAYTVLVDTPVAVALPATLLGAASLRFSLTAPGGDLASDVVLLNGAPLSLGPGGALTEYPIGGELAPAAPVVTLEALSYGFMAFEAPIAACAG